MSSGPIVTVIAPGRAPFEVALERFPFTLGRDPSCDLSIDLPWLSRRHLVFLREGDVCSVECQGQHEVRLDGAPIAGRVRLPPGARIEIGPLNLLFETAGAPTAPGMPAALHEPAITLSPAEAMRPADHLARLGELSTQLAGAGSREEAVGVARAALREAMGGREVHVLLSDQEPPAHVSKHLIARALSAGATLCLDDAGSPPESPSASVEAQRIGPVLIAPLGPPSRGVAYVDRARGDRAFTREDARFCTILAHLTGAALAAAERSGILEAEVRELGRDIERRGRFGRIIGSSAPMRGLAARIEKVAPGDSTVLIQGETGSGKELVAREIHQRSRRSAKAFFAINCAALPETLLESELFGHRRGAFSGADRDRHGIFELAKGGTVFLDEIGELSPTAQAKVLRVLDAREVLPLGGTGPVKIDVRLVAATHRDLEEEIAAGRFRQDLFFRLKVFPIELPPLRDRLEDVPPLVAHFLAESAEARRKGIRRATPSALEALARYEYPGNIRELAHLIERAVILADPGEDLDLPHLPDEIASVPSGAVVPARSDDPPASLREAVADFERALITRELERDGWNRTRTAKRLQVSLRAFMDKLRRYDIKPASE